MAFPMSGHPKCGGDFSCLQAEEGTQSAMRRPAVWTTRRAGEGDRGGRVAAKRRQTTITILDLATQDDFAGQEK